MTSYLLLRSNKETGPYTFEELLNFGLKPYDLVWAKGKSAAWRYPSELDELRPYAPEVEEQPYDRFYKKKEAQTVDPEPSIEISVKPIIEEKKQEAYLPDQTESMAEYLPKPVPAATPTYTPKKSVFVTLPSQVTKIIAEKKQIVSIEQKKSTAAPIPDYTVEQPTITITETLDAKVKYSQPLDEIKEMYVKTLYDRKTKLARKGFWVKNLKIAAVVLGLIAIGLVAGYIIKPKQQDKKLTDVPLTTLPASVSTTDSILHKPLPAVNQHTQSVSKSIPNSVLSEIVPQEKSLTPVNSVSQPEKQTKENLREHKTELPIEKNVIPVDRQESNIYSPSDRNPVTGERSRTVRESSQPTMETTILKFTGNSTGYEGQVFVKSNDYKRVAFGGIRNLELTVTNNSKLELDNVVVELVYLKPSELPLRTENVVFRSIAPNESSRIRIPDTNRGIKVTYKILSVSSREKIAAVANK